MKIKTSARGLTFSFAENECFKVGTHYRYLLNTKENEITIIPDEKGKYKVSKKGVSEKPLLDLRNKEIREMISDADHIEIEILETKIAVHIIRKTFNIDGLSDRELVDMLDSAEKDTFFVDKSSLSENNELLFDMLKASGLFSPKVSDDISYVFDAASLFSGAGMLDYPFKKDDSFDIKFACDFDKSACETYRNNIGDHILCMDVRELETEKVPDVDLILGGVCCQAFSNSNRNTKDTEKMLEKRLLVDEYIRIVKAKKPKVWLIENVPQFLTKESGMYLERVLKELSDYQISYQIVTDYELGGYTKRKRMILIGSCVGKIDIPNVELGRIRTAGEALCKVNGEWFNFSDITSGSAETQRKMAFVRPGHKL